MATVMDRAKANLVFRHPFFASILMRRPLVASTNIPTACVDQRGTISYNPTWVETLTLDQAIFLLAHEAMHVVGQHFTRLHDRNHLRWNVATDAWINDLLTVEGVGQPIPGGVDMPGSMKDTCDNIYNKLPQDMQQMMKAAGMGQPGQGDSSGMGGIGQDLVVGEGGAVSEAEVSAIAAEIKVAVAQAASAAKMAGKLSAALGEIVAKIIESRVPWHDVLERFMISHVKHESTWARKNRRYRDFYLPSRGKTPAMGPVVIQVDVSGSITPSELDHYNGHMQRIMELCRPEMIHVLYVDTQVKRHDTFGPDDEFGLEFYSGGGTDMEEGFRFVEREGVEADVVVVLTDGYTGFTTPPDVPVVWVCSTNQPIPYGEVVRFDTTEVAS